MSKYLSAGATIAILLLLAALGYQTYRAEVLSGDLELEREISERYKSAALANYDVLTRLQSDFNSSLNACFSDFSELSDRFDRYRETIAASEIKPLPKPQSAACEIGGQNALIDALNAFN